MIIIFLVCESEENLEIEVVKKVYIGLLIVSFLFSQRSGWCQSDPVKPQFRRASFAGEYVQIENNKMVLKFFKRVSGYGWGELFSGEGDFLGVLEHLGELKLRDQDIPMRLEAKQFQQRETDTSHNLVFDVASVVIREMLENTSFDVWMRYPFTEPAITGKVTFELMKESSLLHMKYELVSTGNYFAEYIRGPWLKLGLNGFGVSKDDALLPGIDWAIDREWTSGQDWFKDPWAMRAIPHPNKITAPLMAISHKGIGIGLSWDPSAISTRWFNYRSHRMQPVFASPNFIDRSNSHLMGLMVPDAQIEGHENESLADQPLELKIGQKVVFTAELWLSQGRSVATMIDWVKRRGLPPPSPLELTYTELLDEIANAYNTHFWHEGSGFGLIQRPDKKITPSVPSFLVRYVKDNEHSDLAKELAEKLSWCREQIAKGGEAVDSEEDIIAEGNRILARQKPDGSFGFDPGEIGKDDFKVAASFIEPMGVKGDVALDVVIRPARALLKIGQAVGDTLYFTAARKALDFCLNMQRPEGGDFWETPLHAPNLLAAGNAANTYYLAFQLFGDDRYRNKAIYWIRTLLVFTHLWEPTPNSMLYNTKPLLGSSDWYFANWVRDHVQWEVLRTFANASDLSIDWGIVDPEIDWNRYQEGITHAAIRWMYGALDGNWSPHNLPGSFERYQNGEFDYAYPDTHNSVTGHYGGMFIMPGSIVENVYAILDRK